MSQQDSFSTGQIRLHPGVDESEGKHHVYVSHRTCPVCRGTGRLRVDVHYGDPSFGKSVLCSCSKERQESLRLQQRRQAANLDAFRESTFKTFNHRIPGVQQAFRASVEFAVNSEGWLMLIGPCGCGKTHLATAIANQRLDSGATVFYSTTPDLLDALRAAFVSPEQYTRLFTWVREVELLVLDDLGAQQSSAWSNEKLLQILNYRATLVLPTIITAIPKEFQGLDERLRSRLTDSQLVTTVIFGQVKDFRPYKIAASRRT
jgi:DNA replication protein DnaC